MKKTTVTKANKVISYRRFYSARYPNGASARYYAVKLLDIALVIAITLGTVTTAVFMLAIV